MKQLLVDFFPLRYDRTQLLSEAAANNGTFKVKAILQRANAKNQNGRVYPKNILMREAKKYLDEFVQQRRALGELDHPDSSVVNLKNVSHNIVEMRWEGDDLVGTLEILSTPSGNILRELLKNNITLGVSSRGMGSVRELGEGTVEVQDDFSLLCFDVVSNPSTHGAFINESVKQQVANKYSEVDSLIHQFLQEIR